jgi:phage terminase Nu1 subunit (DNA packaging protein)
MATDKDVQLIDDAICVSTREILELFGITKGTLHQWEHKGCPKKARGWWSLNEILRWRGLVSAQGVKTEEELESLSLQEQKLFYEVKLKESQAENYNLRNAIARGDYIEKEIIVSELSRFFIILKRSLLGLSKKLSNEISAYIDPIEARRIESYINDIVIDALEQLNVNGIYKAPKQKK